MSASGLTLKVLGTRGSMAVHGRMYSVFGGATSCYLVRAGEDTVILDAGSGLLNAPVDTPRPPVILISHLHLDHLLGLGMYPRLSKKGAETEIYVPAADSREASESLNSLYSPPLWPVRLDQYAGTVRIKPLMFPIMVGEIRVDGVMGCHPGGCAVMRLSYGGRSIVYLTDYEHEEASFDKMTDFARGADLILYDGQYTEEEYEQKKGFGHSTPEKGLELLERSEAGRLLIVHHDPQNGDEELLKREQLLNRKDVSYARQGEEIYI
ncbi:MAG TPA: MBL fold metallo-hydrolase [Lachnospiraceae bacterium]|nr:MBL fold metallo-hydrolase [Lachnospiraceae bacterium]